MDPVTLFATCTIATASPVSCDSNPSSAVPEHPEIAAEVLRDTEHLDRWQPLIAEASLRFAIPPAWIRAVMHLESNGLTSFNGMPITSSVGAMGLMQLMPDTWRDMRDRYALGSDPYDPRDNILAGTAYLREMYDHDAITLSCRNRDCGL